MKWENIQVGDAIILLIAMEFQEKKKKSLIGGCHYSYSSPNIYRIGEGKKKS